MTNKSQLKNVFRKIHTRRYECFVQMYQIVVEINETRNNFGLHPKDKLFRLCELHKQLKTIEKKFKDLNDQKIIMSCA